MDTSAPQQPPAKDAASSSTQNITIPMDQDPAAQPDPPTQIAIADFVSPAPADVANIKPTAVTTAPPSQADSDIRAFFARPVEIYDEVWSDGTVINTHIDPWTLFFNDPQVSQKVSGFKYARGNLHLQVLINGTPFHYGRTMVSYEPTSCDGLRSNDGDYRQHSCLPHVMVDPTTNTVGHLLCPFISPYEWIDLVNEASNHAGPDQLGKVNIDTIVALAFAGAPPVPDVRLHILAWMEDMELCYPTMADYVAFTPQSDEYEAGEPNKGPISSVLATIATYASYLGEAPVIGPFARATEMTTRGGAALASLFGFSKPRILKAPAEIIPSKYGNMANVDAADSAVSFTLGTKSELSIDPKVTGHNIDHDELAVANFVNRWTVVPTTYSYDVGFSGNILRIPVRPDVGRETVGAREAMTSLDFGCRPFCSWRGGIQFEFTIVCSRYHRGRIRISYEPHSGAPTLPNATYNRNYSRVVDISDTTVFCVTIPYFAKTGYKTLGSHYSGTAADNGTISIDTLNPLTAPLSTADATIFYRVRGADDFQVANPGNLDINTLTAFSSQSGPAQLFLPGSFHLQADANLGEEAERECVDITMFESPTHPLLDAVYYGDPVRSFRSVIKRYERYCTLVGGGTIPNVTSECMTFEMPSCPLQRGSTGVSGGGFVNDGTLTERWNLTRTTTFAYLSSAFLGYRGATRFLVVPTTDSTRLADEEATMVESDPVVTRLPGEANAVAKKGSATPAYTTDAPYSWTETYTPSGLPAWVNANPAGTQVFPKEAAGQRGIHVELPFYEDVRFRRPRSHSVGFTGSRDNPKGGFQIGHRVYNGQGASIFYRAGYDYYFAAGEDMSLIFYRGPPLMWVFENINPIDYSAWTYNVSTGKPYSGPDN